ncbi:hypothetical protein Bca52824_028853 [Brassica carinata]|uniref:K-box domain-containing protein n=1 Tax=Brassica carinata TaxID=52824 RepID=A0A8X7VDP9_BRACI|nr:hypothetical protein Bca52824_028853 [Brassica carinata]
MSRTTRRSEKQRLQYVQVIQDLKEEIKLLQISNEKLNGVGLESLSYTELASLESMLNEGLRIVDEQIDKAYEVLTLPQVVECDIMGWDWVNQNDKDDLAYQSLLAKRRRELRNKSRELRLGPPQKIQQHYDPERLVSTIVSHLNVPLSPHINCLFLQMLDIDSLKIEKERLRLLNQRMIGKELDGMGYFELYVLHFEISRATMNAEDMMRKIKRARPVDKEPISPVQI